MVLIQSINEDQSTNDVIKWLIHFKQKFLRLNDVASIAAFKYVNDNFIITVNNKEIDFSKVDFYWYRRGKFEINFALKNHSDKHFGKEINTYIQNENSALLNYFLVYLKRGVKHSGSFITDVGINKMFVLDKANECNLAVPPSIITGDKIDVSGFLKKQCRIITKPLHSAFHYYSKEYWFPTYTTEVDFAVLKAMPDTFEHSLFQKLVEKKFEIRAFFWDSTIFSMAIFSQSDDQSKIDFRNYVFERPNRCVPFNLPQKLSKKILELANSLNINSGSADLIYSIDSEFVFLEINPVGQFGMVSYPCNYYLEKFIASKISSYGSKKNKGRKFGSPNKKQ